MMRRMPLTTQRRNTAYLNRQFFRFGRLDRNLDDRASCPVPDLRLISEARTKNASDQVLSALPTWTSYSLECAA
jgi:hypothetical protein